LTQQDWGLKETDSDGYSTCEDSFNRRAEYDLLQRLLTEQITTAEAVVEAHVDRSTIMTIKKTAHDDAFAALSVKAGRPKSDPKERSETQRLAAEIERFQSTVIEQAVELAVLRGKSAWG
jgi:hypothetical protein